MPRMRILSASEQEAFDKPLLYSSERRMVMGGQLNFDAQSAMKRRLSASSEPVSQYTLTSGADMDAATALAAPHENHAILRFANLRSIDPGPF